jgi:multiple sugar transport system ATP-binding protein
MGSDVFVYFTQDSGLSGSVDQLADLAQDSGKADTGASDETVTARLDPTTRLREGEEAELWADTRAMHVFDPETGKNLTAAAQSAAGSAGSPGPATSAGAAGSAGTSGPAAT